MVGHQGGRKGPFFFALVMDRLSDEVRQAACSAICSETREQVEESLERWRNALV